jgi:hypothetical protein
VLEPDHQEIRGLLRTLLVVAALALAGSAQAATPSDSVKLARAVKANMIPFYKKTSPELAFTKVTCVLAPMATTGHCKAHFTIVKERVTGYFDVTATINRSTGGVHLQATKTTCKDTKTGAPVGC